LGYLFYFSRTIWAPILGHFIKNTMAVLFYYFYADQINKEIDSIGASEGSYGYLLVSIILISSFLFVFYKYQQKSISD